VNVPKKRNTRKQSNGPGPVTIRVCGAGFAPIRVEYRSSRGQAPDSLAHLAARRWSGL
jgi:hypothetical protein